MSANLKGLVEVRSTLANELVSYFDALAARMSKLPKYYPPRFGDGTASMFDALRQRVVLVDRRKRSERRADAKTSSGHSLGRAYDTPVLPSAAPVTDGSSSFPWDDGVIERFRRLVVLGDPGAGKSWILRREAWRLARAGANQIARGQIDVGNVILPIFARLSDLAASSSLFEDSLAQHVSSGYSDRFAMLVRSKVVTGECVLFLDALDEVPAEQPTHGQPVMALPGYRQHLVRRLRDFALRHQHPRLVMTSRIVGYDGSPFDGSEVDVVPLENGQLEVFARAWLLDRAGDFLASLENVHLLGLARIPLMLALLCRMVEAARRTEAAALPNRRTKLYEQCLQGLLRDWQIVDKGRTSDSIVVSQPYVAALIEILGDVSLELLEEGRQEFSESLFGERLRNRLGALPPGHELYGRTPSSLIGEFKNAGVLTLASDVDDSPLLLLHFSIQQYLAARALSTREDWLARSVKHVYDPSWQEVLELLGGLLGERLPQYIFTLLRNHDEDLFCRRLLLAIRAAGQGDEGDLPSAYAIMLVDEVIALVVDPPPWINRRELHTLLAPWPDVAIPRLANLWTSPQAFGRWGWRSSRRHFHTLRNGRIGQYLLRCFWWLRSWAEQCDDDVREAVQETIETIRSPEVIPTLRLISQRDERPATHQAMLIRLAKLAGPAFLPELRTRLNVADTYARVSIVRDLAAAGFHHVVDDLLEWFRQEGGVSSKNWHVASLLRDLGRITSPSVSSDVDELCRALAGPDCCLAAQRLAELGHAAAIPQLRRMISGGHRPSQEVAIDALVRLNARDALPELIEASQPARDWMTGKIVYFTRAVEAALTLGEAGEYEHIPRDALLVSPSAIDALAQAYGVEQMGDAPLSPLAAYLSEQGARTVLHEELIHEDVTMRLTGVAVLERIRGDWAKAHLEAMSTDRDPHVRMASLRALRRIGYARAITPLRVVLHDIAVTEFTQDDANATEDATADDIDVIMIVLHKLAHVAELELIYCPADTDTLMDLVMNDSLVLTQVMAAVILGTRRERASISALVLRLTGMLGSPYPPSPERRWLVASIAWALGEMRADELPVMMQTVMLADDFYAPVALSILHRIREREAIAVPPARRCSPIRKWFRHHGYILNSGIRAVTSDQ